MLLYNEAARDTRPHFYILTDGRSSAQLQTYAEQLDRALEGNAKICLIDSSDGSGVDICSRYTVGEDSLPAMILIQSDESVYQDWYDSSLPPVDQAAYLARQITG